VIREQLRPLLRWEDHHKTLVGRLLIVLLATLAVDALGTVAIYFAERHAPRSEITSMWDAFFFSTVQLLTVSSQIRNPFTTSGRIVDIVLEVWAVLVVAGSAGAIASFLQDAGKGRTA
jgi:hypothetical protein